MKLKSLRIQRFKNIEDAILDLGDVNVLVGGNIAGKSSVLQATHFAIGLLQAITLDHKWGATKNISFAPSQLIYSPCEDVSALGRGGILKEDESTAIVLEMTFQDGSMFSVSVRKGRNRNILVGVTNQPVAKQVASLESPYTIFTPGLAGIAKSEAFVSDGVLRRTIARGDANIVLRNTLFRLWQSDQSDGFLSDLAKIFPDTGLDVKFDMSVDESIGIMVRSGGAVVPLESAGTGLLQAIQILSYVHYFHPTFLLLDEPDSHLHPNNQRVLCRLLTLIAEERHIQVLLSTHSRHVLDALRGTSRTMWVRGGRVEPTSCEDHIDVLLDIGALDIKERLALQRGACVILTEDAITGPLQNLLQACGFDMTKTQLLPYYGCTEPHNLRPLIRIIKESSPRAKVLLHRDRDYLTDSEAAEWEKDVRALGAEPFLTKDVCLESYFLDADHIHALNNDVDLQSCKALLQQAVMECRDASVAKQVNSRLDIERKRKTAGNLDMGKLAVEAPRNYDNNPRHFAHAKAVLRHLRSLWQAHFKKNLNIEQDSPHLQDPTLLGLATKIFGAHKVHSANGAGTVIKGTSEAGSSTLLLNFEG